MEATNPDCSSSPVQVLDEAGNSEPGGSIAALVDEARANWPGCFESDGRGGGGAPSNGRAPTSTSTISRAAFDQLSPALRSAKISAGIRVVD